MYSIPVLDLIYSFLHCHLTILCSWLVFKMVLTEMCWFTEGKNSIAKESQANYEKLGTLTLLLPDAAESWLEPQSSLRMWPPQLTLPQKSKEYKSTVLDWAFSIWQCVQKNFYRLTLYTGQKLNWRVSLLTSCSSHLTSPLKLPCLSVYMFQLFTCLYFFDSMVQSN